MTITGILGYTNIFNTNILTLIFFNLAPNLFGWLYSLRKTTLAGNLACQGKIEINNWCKNRNIQ